MINLILFFFVFHLQYNVFAAVPLIRERRACSGITVDSITGWSEGIMRVGTLSSSGCY